MTGIKSKVDGEVYNETPVRVGTGSQAGDIWQDRDIVHSHRQLNPDLAESIRDMSAEEIFQKGLTIYGDSGPDKTEQGKWEWMATYYGDIYPQFKSYAEKLRGLDPSISNEVIVDAFLNGDDKE